MTRTPTTVKMVDYRDIYIDIYNDVYGYTGSDSHRLSKVTDVQGSVHVVDSGLRLVSVVNNGLRLVRLANESTSSRAVKVIIDGTNRITVPKSGQTKANVL